MPYIQETCVCGRVVEVRKYYSARYNKKGLRQCSVSSSTEAVKKNNLKYAKTKLRRILNANFSKGDFHVTLLYKTSEGMVSEEEAERNIKNTLRRVSYAMKKKGIPFKYIYITEKGKKRGRIHHHIVINKEAVRFLQKQWRNGRTSFTPIYTDNLEALAEYLLKSYEGLEEFSGRRYHKSASLIIPVSKKRVVSADSWREVPIAPKGYYLDKESVDEGICEFTGYPYQSYSLIRIT